MKARLCSNPVASQDYVIFLVATFSSNIASSGGSRRNLRDGVSGQRAQVT